LHFQRRDDTSNTTKGRTDTVLRTSQKGDQYGFERSLIGHRDRNGSGPSKLSQTFCRQSQNHLGPVIPLRYSSLWCLALFPPPLPTRLICSPVEAMAHLIKALASATRKTHRGGKADNRRTCLPLWAPLLISLSRPAPSPAPVVLLLQQP
jgi:hypothetical protein